MTAATPLLPAALTEAAAGIPPAPSGGTPLAASDEFTTLLAALLPGSAPPDAGPEAAQVATDSEDPAQHERDKGERPVILAVIPPPAPIPPPPPAPVESVTPAGTSLFTPAAEPVSAGRCSIPQLTAEPDEHASSDGSDPLIQQPAPAFTPPEFARAADWLPPPPSGGTVQAPASPPAAAVQADSPSEAPSLPAASPSGAQGANPRPALAFAARLTDIHAAEPAAPAPVEPAAVRPNSGGAAPCYNLTPAEPAFAGTPVNGASPALRTPAPPPDPADLTPRPAGLPPQQAHVGTKDAAFGLSAPKLPEEGAPAKSDAAPSLPPAAETFTLPRPRPVRGELSPASATGQPARAQRPGSGFASAAAAPAAAPPSLPRSSGAVDSVRAAAPAAPAAAPESPAAPPQPVREISMLIPRRGAPGLEPEAVEVRVLDRRGQVHVAVRSADEHLNQSLGDRLGELTAQLERGGYRVETWRPAGQTALAGASLSAAETSGQQLRDPAGRAAPDPEHRHPGGSGGDSSHPERRHDERARPQWLDLFEESLQPQTGTPRSTDHDILR